MTKLSKATVLVLLPITMAFSAGALGGRNPEPEKSETMLATTQIAEKRKAAPLEPLTFTMVEDNVALLREYPFLKSVLDDVNASDATGIFVKTVLFTSTYKDEKTGTNLLFLNYSGSPYCGSMGCVMDVYADKGNDVGYQHVRSFSVMEPLYISRDAKGASLVYCDADGARQFLFTGAFTETKPASESAVKACTFEPQTPPPAPKL